jgi:hypothetical protein
MSKKINNQVFSRNQLALVMLGLFVQSCLGMYAFATNNTIESIALAAGMILLEVFLFGQLLVFGLALEWIANKFKLDLETGGKK